MILGPIQMLSSKLVKEWVAPFLKAQERLEKADLLVDEAELAVHRASLAVAAADEVQDAAALELASALAGDGFDRGNPFKAFGAMAPSKLVNQGVLVEARSLTALAAAVLAHPKPSAASRRAATAVERAARAMTATSQQHAERISARVAAVKQRDQTLPADWRSALADLKTAIRYADLVESTTHYASIFAGVNRALAAATAKKKGAVAVTVPIAFEPVS